MWGFSTPPAPVVPVTLALFLTGCQVPPPPLHELVASLSFSGRRPAFGGPPPALPALRTSGCCPHGCRLPARALRTSQDQLPPADQPGAHPRKHAFPGERTFLAGVCFSSCGSEPSGGTSQKFVQV